LNELYLTLLSEGIDDIRFMGINGPMYIDDNYQNMINGRILPWVQDTEESNIWYDWDVTLRDLFILDRNGNFVTKINLTTYNPDPNTPCATNYDALYELLISLRER